MSPLLKNFLHFPFFILLVCANSIASEPTSTSPGKETDFHFFQAITKQDAEMHWWKFVPARVAPRIQNTSSIVPNEVISIFPVFANYEVGDDGQTDVSWSLEITNPEGVITTDLTDLVGLEGKNQPRVVLPSVTHLCLSWDETDIKGNYTIRMSAKDLLRDQDYQLEAVLELVEFTYKPKDKDFQKWFFEYPQNPDPEAALWHFTHPLRPYIENKKGPIWSALWLFKCIYENNEFLIAETVSFFDSRANKQQKQDIILLFHLIDKLDQLELKGKFLSYAEKIQSIKIPDPYSEITSGQQLDMLWAEFFATARIEPLKHFMSVFENSKYFGTKEKVESGELNKKDPVVRQQLYTEAVFNSAIWSLGSNLMRSDLLLHNCIYILESNELPQSQGSYLQMMLKQCLQKRSEEEKSPE